MLMLGRMLTMAMALLGGIFFSQAPEFAQQYRQRIGGALDELKILISEFDAQANHNGLDRQEALNIYSVSPQTFLRNQGEAMRRTFSRYEMLAEQQKDLTLAPPFTKPFVVMRNPDSTTFANAWRDFVPGVPVDFAGLTWAAGGLFCGWLIAALLGAARRGVVRSVRRPKRMDQTPTIAR
ncbi:DUF2937 family protein [Neorhizobium galegae]|uniref:DUF2937 family protein n=1 Tax=Neorhizobium galegae TaxID=399 RepID=UPI000620EF83|nr:DUF2937 family protein [Neorhizobium galegae]CDZ27067.1 Hypothetical protein NGAL_HAMBI490_19090 [Neorhizobium galegae bv. officinalis]KAA9388762.1 DUF2937 family protein [Neorhizobium galegae]KAB1116382.1 DUF2937 family protein [Neorhizobium galegae]MCM2498138.1 DUF2937 family protein [Neorhizobium galegae]MCQ1768756.1 DUF2937 family protein [Neorhizobium galegae]